MKSFGLGILLGAIFGFFAALVIVTESAAPPPVLDPGTAKTTDATTASPSSAAIAVLEADLQRRLRGASDAKLAETLDEAYFQRDWSRVRVASRLLRARPPARGSKGAAGSGNPSLTGVSDDWEIPLSLVGLEQELRRRAELQQLRLRDDAATRLIPRASEEDAVAQLVDLFQAPRASGDAATQKSAARVLALGATDRGREVLLRALRDPDLGPLASQALGQCEDPKTFPSLIELVARDPEPRVRVLAAEALGSTSLVARSDPPDAVVAIAKLARTDADDKVRAAAVDVLGRADLARSEPARTALVELVTAPSEPVAVRARAAQAIRRHHETARSTPRDVLEALERTLPYERNIEVQTQLGQVLGEIGGRTTVPALEGALRDATDAGARAALDAALAKVKARVDPKLAERP
jgi:HEAT repeat protein